MHLDKFILIIFPLTILLNFLIIKNFSHQLLHKIVDKEFNKPQSFHVNPVPRIGGLLIFFYFILFSIFFFEKNFFLLKILSLLHCLQPIQHLWYRFYMVLLQ